MKNPIILEGPISSRQDFNRVIYGLREATYIINENEFKIRANRKRFTIFRENRYCISCGRDGNTITLRFDKKSGVFCDLFHKDKDKYILMTIDHKLPISLGGTDCYENLQTMCCMCNNAKGNNPEWTL